MTDTKSNDFPVWGMWDLFMWKLVPGRFGGGRAYIQKYKDAWVRHNKNNIKIWAAHYNFPAELLAGVCWIEVGGDPNFIDRIAFEVRTFDWCGPTWVDQHMTVTSHPAKTSFGAVSIQLRTAAETMELEPSEMTTEQLRELALSLERDVYNIQIVARHLRLLIDHDKLQKNPPLLSEDNIRIVGARYNRGMGLSLEQIKKNTSYGDFIVKFMPRFKNLLW